VVVINDIYTNIDIDYKDNHIKSFPSLVQIIADVQLKHFLSFLSILIF